MVLNLLCAPRVLWRRLQHVQRRALGELLGPGDQPPCIYSLAVALALVGQPALAQSGHKLSEKCFPKLAGATMTSNVGHKEVLKLLEELKQGDRDVDAHISVLLGKGDYAEEDGMVRILGAGSISSR